MKAILIYAGLLATLAFSASARARDQAPTLSAAAITIPEYRASKIIGTLILSDAGDKVGTIDDVIVADADHSAYAILSVGSFLGVGMKLVAVPFGALDIARDKIVLPGATKDALMALPKFTYARSR